MKLKYLIIFCLLYCSGVAAQTMQLVKDINPAGSTIFGSFCTYNNKLYFGGYDGTKNNLWYTDGTTAGTQILDLSSIDSISIYTPIPLAGCNNKLFINMPQAQYNKLVVTDGTLNGTLALKSFSYIGTSFATHNNVLYFSAGDSTHGVELWRSDGTIAGTVMVRDLYPGTISGVTTDELIEYGNGICFAARDTASNAELWFSDGSATGTVRIKDLNGTIAGSDPSGFYIYNNNLFFKNAYLDPEPWVTDGTTAGTHQLKDLKPGNSGSSPGPYYTCNGKLLFTATLTTNKTTLISSDGTENGTTAIKEIPAAFGNMCLNGSSYFVGADSLSDYELWTSDHTAAGTHILKNINPTNTSSPLITGVLENKMIIIADEGSNGYELWLSDGTEQGTYKPGFSNAMGNSPIPPPGYTTSFAYCNNAIYIPARYNNTGLELWKLTLNPTGITETGKQVAEFTLSPNPANDQLQIKTNAPGSVKLMDLMGKTHYSVLLGIGTTTINVSSLSSGIYYIVNEQTGEVKRFVKQ